MISSISSLSSGPILLRTNQNTQVIHQRHLSLELLLRPIRPMVQLPCKDLPRIAWYSQYRDQTTLQSGPFCCLLSFWIRLLNSLCDHTVRLTSNPFPQLCGQRVLQVPPGHDHNWIHPGNNLHFLSLPVCPVREEPSPLSSSSFPQVLHSVLYRYSHRGSAGQSGCL